MPVDMSSRDNQLVVRELAFTLLVVGIVALPALFSLGIVAWAAIGSLFAFAVVHPRSLVFAVPAAIALSFQPVELGNLQLNMLEILVIVAVAGYAPRIIAGTWKLKAIPPEQRYIAMRRIVPDRIAAGIALLLLFGGATAVFWMADGSYADESLRTYRWTILFPVAYFFIAAPVFHQRELFRTMAAGLFIAGASSAAIIAIVDGLLGGGVQADAVTRLSGFAPHPNALALVLVRALVLGALIAVLFRDRLSTYWLYPSVLIGVVTVLTFSRGAVLGVLAGVLLILLLARAGRIAFAAGGAVITGIAWMLVMAPERALSLLGGGSGSLRIELWQSSMQMIADHSLTGVGPDQFLYQYLPRYVSPAAWPERFTSHPHNILLDAWLSIGIIGVIILGMIIWLLVRNIRVALPSGDRISLAAAGALVTAGAHGMVDQSYFLPELAMSAWFLICLLIPGVEHLPEEVPADAGNPPESKG